MAVIHTLTVLSFVGVSLALGMVATFIGAVLWSVVRRACT